MTQNGHTRRLAAILAADVAGYGRLMEADDSGTLAALEDAMARIVAPAVARGHGRVFKTTGDGLLAEFESAVAAVECALAIQSAMAEPDSGGPPLRFRIGVNLGDVLSAGDDLFGDGVNIAARIEALADPGGIVVSSNVHEQVRNRVDAGFTDLGPQRLKNISMPVRVFAMAGPGAARAAEARHDDRPSVAVLPFTVMSGEPGPDYLAEGITENVITGLSHFRDLSVIASNSTFAYRGRATKVTTVAAELGASYVLEGSIQRAGGRVRISAQLCDGETGRSLWSQRYDRTAGDVFELQDEVTEMIVGTLATTYGGRIRKAWKERRRPSGTRDFLALDHFLRGMDLLNRFTPAENAAARLAFRRAAELDPGFAKPLAKIAWSHMMDAYLGWSADLPAAWATALEYATLALGIDDDEAWGHYALAGYSMYMRQHERAISEYELALSLNPNDADIINDFGLCLSYAGRPEEGLVLARRAMRLNPHHPEFYRTQLGQILFDARRYAEAVAVLEGMRSGETALSMIYLAASQAGLGNVDAARAAAARAVALDPAATVGRWANFQVAPYREERDLAHLRDNLARAGLPH